MDALESNPAIESLLNCSVCLEPFDCPKLLRCGHTFCLECLEQMCGEASVITCPMCKQKTLKPAEGLDKLTDDFRVSQIRDGLQAATQIAIPQAKCEVCRRASANVRCLQCHKAMCNTCRDKHNRRAEAASHTLLLLQDVIKCDIHDDDCSHICKDCRALICMSCVLDKCGDHSCKEIGEAARDCIIGGKLRGGYVKNVLEGFQGGKQKQLELFANIEREIQSHADRITTAIRSEGKRLKDELTVLQKDTLEKLELSRLAAEERLVKLTSLPDTSAESLQAGIPSELLKALPNLMDDKGPDLDECKVTEIKFEPTIDPAQLKLGSLIIKGIKSQSNKGDFKVFHFEKVIHDTRGDNKALVGKYRDIIARNDYMSEGPKVRIYRKGEPGGYMEQEKLVDSFASIFTRDCKSLLPHLGLMAAKVKAYAREHNIPLTYVDPKQARKVSQDYTRRPPSGANQDRQGPRATGSKFGSQGGLNKFGSQTGLNQFGSQGGLNQSGSQSGPNKTTPTKQGPKGKKKK